VLVNAVSWTSGNAAGWLSTSSVCAASMSLRVSVCHAAAELALPGSADARAASSNTHRPTNNKRVMAPM
jgi:hypothetical protein